MTESTSAPLRPVASPEAIDSTRLIGQELKNVLAIADDCVERLHQHLLDDDAVARELAELSRVLAHAEHLTGAVLAAPRPPASPASERWLHAVRCDGESPRQATLAWRPRTTF
ncbi:MAG TPA: hypothetical protein VF424_08750 [Vicinamibacterales bacterium]